jgi:hypothetical protein
MVLLFTTNNFLTAFNPIRTRCAHHLNKSSLTLICQCPRTTKSNICHKKTGEETTKSECKKMSRCINVQIGQTKNGFVLGKKTEKRYKNDS